MKILIVANWKCSPETQAEAERIFGTVKKGIRNIKNMEVVICPPFLYLSGLKILASRMQEENSKLKIQLGAQDCFWENNGPYTGEISPEMLRNLRVAYVIIGHSERRNYFGETNEMINKKLLAAFRAGLKPVLCVGEKEREDMLLVVKEQIKKGLKGINKAQAEKLVIAYEPIWAIGTGNPCSSDDAMRATLFIRQTITKIYNRKIAEEVTILYGGSVNSKIAADYIKEARMNGLLVGGASLDAQEFIKIVKNV